MTGRRAKVAHLSSVHPAIDTRIGTKECRTLMAAGYDVVFVCAHPGPDVVNGVRIVPVKERRGRVARMTLTTLDVLRAALRERASVYHLHDPELLPVGAMLRLVTDATVIYDVHEDVPRLILVKSWLPAVLRRPVAMVAGIVEHTLARFMSGIVAATPPIAKRFPGARTVTVQNFAMQDELVLPRPTPYAERPATFAYIGAIDRIRGATQMVDAVARVPRELGARLILGGLCDDAFQRELRGMPGWPLVHYPGWQSREEVARHLDQSRAGLLLIHPTRNYLDSYPGKAFEYMAAGLPLIMSDFPLWRELFGEIGCGIFVNPLDPDAIAQAMTWVLEHPRDAEQMGAKGRVAVRERFSWSAESRKLLDLYASLVRDRTGDTIEPSRPETARLKREIGV